jgi:hypothetical protein
MHIICEEIQTGAIYSSVPTKELDALIGSAINIGTSGVFCCPFFFFFFLFFFSSEVGRISCKVKLFSDLNSNIAQSNHII